MYLVALKVLQYCYRRINSPATAGILLILIDFNRSLEIWRFSYYLPPPSQQFLVQKLFQSLFKTYFLTYQVIRLLKVP